jgi:hypothetical protein
MKMVVVVVFVAGNGNLLRLFGNVYIDIRLKRPKLDAGGQSAIAGCTDRCRSINKTGNTNTVMYPRY